MIEILHEYWKPLLWTDGYRFTGVAITLWLLILSVVIGGVLALFLAIGRVSSNKYIQFPIWLFTYIFRGMFSCWCSIPACTRLRLLREPNSLTLSSAVA